MRFLRKVLRRPTFVLSHLGRLYRWSLEARHVEPRTLCEALLAVAERGVTLGAGRCKEAVPSKVMHAFPWIWGAYILAYAVYMVVHAVLLGWTYLLIIGMGTGAFAGFVLGLVVLYFFLRWAGPRFCPFAVVFNGNR